MYFILKNKQNQDIRKTFFVKEIKNIKSLKNVDFKDKTSKMILSLS